MSPALSIATAARSLSDHITPDAFTLATSSVVISVQQAILLKSLHSLLELCPHVAPATLLQLLPALPAAGAAALPMTRCLDSALQSLLATPGVDDVVRRCLGGASAAVAPAAAPPLAIATQCAPATQPARKRRRKLPLLAAQATQATQADGGDGAADFGGGHSAAPPPGLQPDAQSAQAVMPIVHALLACLERLLPEQYAGDQQRQVALTCLAQLTAALAPAAPPALLLHAARPLPAWLDWAGALPDGSAVAGAVAAAALGAAEALCTALIAQRCAAGRQRDAQHDDVALAVIERLPLVAASALQQRPTGSGADAPGPAAAAEPLSRMALETAALTALVAAAEAALLVPGGDEPRARCLNALRASCQALVRHVGGPVFYSFSRCPGSLRIHGKLRAL